MHLLHGVCLLQAILCLLQGSHGRRTGAVRFARGGRDMKPEDEEEGVDIGEGGIVLGLARRCGREEEDGVFRSAAITDMTALGFSRGRKGGECSNIRISDHCLVEDGATPRTCWHDDATGMVNRTSGRVHPSIASHTCLQTCSYVIMLSQMRYIQCYSRNTLHTSQAIGIGHVRNDEPTFTLAKITMTTSQRPRKPQVPEVPRPRAHQGQPEYGQP